MWQKTVHEVWTVSGAGSATLVQYCSRCKTKREYRSSEKFRVNANGKRIDVWLIFNCVVCKNSWNFSVEERRSVSSLSNSLLEKFLANDPELARESGAKMKLSQGECVIEKKTLVPSDTKKTVQVFVRDGVRVRLDRVLSLGLEVSRGLVSQWIEEGRVSCVSKKKSVWKKPVRDGFCFCWHESS